MQRAYLRALQWSSLQDEVGRQMPSASSQPTTVQLLKITLPTEDFYANKPEIREDLIEIVREQARHGPSKP